MNQYTTAVVIVVEQQGDAYTVGSLRRALGALLRREGAWDGGGGVRGHA